MYGYLKRQTSNRTRVKKEKMKLFITGANGYIGRNFIKYAVKQNIKIFAVTSKKKIKKSLM